MRHLLYSFLLFGMPLIALAQEVTPKNGAVITRTSVLFEVEEVIGASNYRFEITPSQGKSIVIEDPNHVVRVDGLSFGTSYHWKVVAFDAKDRVMQTVESDFSIATSNLVDPELNRFPIEKNAENKQVDGVLFLDYSRVAITPDGTPVWFLPELDYLENKRLRDFKLTRRGTLTYLDIRNCEELTLDGTSLWETPSNGNFSGDTTDYYHHEFTRLSNGHYMVLGKTFVESSLTVNGAQISQIPLSIIIEYDAQGKVVWTWSSNQYVRDEDIVKVGQKVAVGNTFGHMNSFYMDEVSGIVYVGFRDLNCILAVEKESGEILHSYGDKIPSDTTQQAIGFFRKQHAPIKLRGDKLLLFNNNDKKQPSSVQIISEVTRDNPVSKIEWEFTCDFDTLMPQDAGRMGNALPLDSGNILVNMGQVARIFEVSPEKEVLWQCLPETWNEAQQQWKPRPNYRAFHASSLYPYYHAVSLRGNEIEVSNEGSENDTYRISVYKKHTNRLKVASHTFSVKQGQISTIDLKELIGRKRLPKSVYVTVRSINNPDGSVTKQYQLR